jgi:hypothetical protein
MAFVNRNRAHRTEDDMLDPANEDLWMELRDDIDEMLGCEDALLIDDVFARIRRKVQALEDSAAAAEGNMAKDIKKDCDLLKSKLLAPLKALSEYKRRLRFDAGELGAGRRASVTGRRSVSLPHARAQFKCHPWNLHISTLYPRTEFLEHRYSNYASGVGRRASRRESGFSPRSPYMRGAQPGSAAYWPIARCALGRYRRGRGGLAESQRSQAGRAPQRWPSCAAAGRCLS